MNHVGTFSLLIYQMSLALLLFPVFVFFLCDYSSVLIHYSRSEGKRVSSLLLHSSK